MQNSKKRKLLFIYGPLGGGGAERVLLDILHNIDYNRYDVDLALITAQGILLPEVPKKVNIIPLWEDYTLLYKIGYRLSKWFRINTLFSRRINKKLTSLYDVEISFLEGMPLKLHTLHKTKAKKITWVHCDLDKFRYEADSFYKGEELAAYKSMDKIICVSKDAEQAFIRRFPECIGQTDVIYNPINSNKIKKMAEAIQVGNNKFTIITVGRLTEQKRMDRIIRLAARLKSEGSNIKFQILGDGELKDTLLRQRKNADVEDMVEFSGFNSNPFPYIKAADMMLCCSEYEGFCLAICEAMCLGTPVISTKTAGPTEILNNNKYGLLTDHDDESIYQSVISMLRDKALRDKYSSIGKEKIQDFDINSIMNRVYQLIN